MSGRGSAPGEHHGGRKKGTRNKLTADLKSMIEGALDARGRPTHAEMEALRPGDEDLWLDNTRRFTT